MYIRVRASHMGVCNEGVCIILSIVLMSVCKNVCCKCMQVFVFVVISCVLCARGHSLYMDMSLPQMKFTSPMHSTRNDAP